MADGKIPKSLRKKVLSEEGAECSQCGVEKVALTSGQTFAFCVLAVTQKRDRR
jgi:hypothetical protein